MNTRKTISRISLLIPMLALGLAAAPAQAGHRDHDQGWQSGNSYRDAGHGHYRSRAYERGFEAGYRKGFRKAKKRFKHACRERHGHGERYRNGYRHWDSKHEYEPREYHAPARHGGNLVDVLFDTLEKDFRLVVHHEKGHRW